LLIKQLPNPANDLNRLVIYLEPSDEEIPLTGGAGRIFNNLLRSAGIKRDGLTVLGCRGTYSSIHYSDLLRDHVLPFINSRAWSRIDLIGEKALKLVGDKRGGIAKWRGSPLDIHGQRGMATYDPLYLMRDQEMLPVAANDLTKSLIEPPEHYEPFPSIDSVRAFNATTFAFDIECPRYKLLGDSAPAEMVGLCAASTEAMCVPIRGEYASELKRIFRDAKTVIGHNCIQFDLPKLRNVDIGISPECQVHDTMLLQHLVFPTFPHDLEFVGSQFVSKPAWKDDKDGGWEPYCCRDTDVTYQVWLDLLPLVRQHNLQNLYEHVQVPLASICSLMHKTGFKVNPGRIGEVREKLLKELDELEQVLPAFLRGRLDPIKRRTPAPPGTVGKSGKPVKYVLVDSTERVVPWRSPAEKQRFLYSDDPGCLGLQPVHDLKSGRVTTGKMAIAKLFGKTRNPAILALGKLNKIDELLTTFASEKLSTVHRVYPHFNVHGTASGRLSSSDPNLQNIPESTRCIYVPSHEGWKIVDVDYSNIENRLTAILAGDSTRLKKYEDPKYSDYKLLVSRAYGIPESEVIKDNSREAPYGKCKAIVLGINYGLGAKKISKMYDIELKEVYHLLDTWKSEIKLTSLWQTRTANTAIRDGVLTTPFGRKRWFWTTSAYTESLSFLPQSCAADIIFRAMIGLMYERIGWPEWKAKLVSPITGALPKPSNLLLQVHDSLVFECPAAMVDELVAIVRLVMQQPWKELGGEIIPISVKIGDSWGD
jgi:DNA polymerase I-like protein with 3'-5' exonuclease and polymerase domains